MKLPLLSLFTDLFRPIPTLPSPSLSSKTVLIVGANTGLGFEAAKHLARLNPNRLILGCRNLDKGDAAAERIKNEVEGFEGVVEVWQVDLADFKSVKEFVDRITNPGEGGLDRLDLLVLNAGVGQFTEWDYVPTKDGFEHALQINNISQSWIALRSLPLLIRTGESFNVRPRMVVVGSEMHYWGSIPDEAFNSSNAWKFLGGQEYCSRFSVIFRRYFDTKLLNMFFVRALNNRVKSQNLIVNCVNPGLCQSDLFRNVRGIHAALLSVYLRVMARKGEEGGKMIAWACIGAQEEENNLKGAYLNVCCVEEPSDFVLGKEGQRREDKLWVDLLDTLMDMDENLKDDIRPYVQ